VLKGNVYICDSDHWKVRPLFGVLLSSGYYFYHSEEDYEDDDEENYFFAQRKALKDDALSVKYPPSLITPRFLLVISWR